jgi:amino acid transporter
VSRLVGESWQSSSADVCISATELWYRNLNYWDSVSTLAGEVPMPHKTFPRALCAAVILVVLTYALPLMVGLGVTQTVGDWKLGYFAYIAKEVPHLPSHTPTRQLILRNS